VSTLVTEVPPIHYVLAMLGGALRVAEYATFGTPELAASVVAALGDSHACLLANHGAVTVGGTLAAAYDRALQVEWLCQVWLAATAAGEPKLLSTAEIAKVSELARDYGEAGRER
jgi:L-fuculose-phosphate aldolase